MGLETRIVSDDDLFDVISIGAGPAGLTACSECAQAGLKTAYMDKNAPGGRLLNLNQINNLPGFEGIDGPTLAGLLYQKAQDSKVVGLNGEVSRLGRYQNYHVIYDQNGRALYCSALIIATGIGEQKLDAIDAHKYDKAGISSCVTCDSSLAKGQDVAVYGNSNKAIEQVLQLSEICPKVYLICDLEKLDASEEQINKLNALTNLQILYNSRIHQVLGNDFSLNTIVVKNIKNGLFNNIPVSFIFIGLEDKPVTQFIANSEIVDNKGFVIANNDTTTKIPGIYAIGDVVQNSVKQIINALTTGSICANQIINYLKKK